MTVVTINHRLAVFGFLCLEDDVLSGNSGLKDIVSALEWIKNNIEFFGGDNSRITLLGAGGGGAAVDMLLHSSAKHLFEAAIIQSGTSWTSQYFQENLKERAFRLAQILDRKSSNNKGLLKSLQDISVNNLLLKEWDANPQDYFLEQQRNILTFGPVIENNSNGLLTTYPENSKISIDKPILIGFNSRDGIEAALQYLIEPRYLTFVNEDFPLNMPKRLKFRFDPESSLYDEAIKQIKDFYFVDGKITPKHINEFTTYIGDVFNMYAIDNTVQLYANATSKPIYYYLFDYSSELNENKMNLLQEITVKKGVWGASIGDELCYLFKCPNLTKYYEKYNDTNHNSIIVHRRMIRMWANFAKKQYVHY